MKKRYRSYQPDQQMLMPPSFGDLLPKEHVAHFIRQAVERFDLREIYRSYEAVKGQPPYEPSMMVTVLFYAYSRGVRSSREIERMLWEDIPMRYLSGNQQPNFWTIAAFRKRHLEALAKLFTQTVVMADKAGLVALTTVAVDGTKLRANASKHRAMSYGRLEAEEKRLQETITRQLEEAVAQDDAAAAEDGDGPGNGSGGSDAKRLKQVQDAKTELERRAQEREENRQQAVRERGAIPRPSRLGGAPRSRDQINFTDPDSRIMKSGDGSFVQGYNGEAVVDTDSQIIVAADLTNMAADAPHLVPLMEQTRKNTGRLPRNALADAGFFSEQNVTELQRQGIEAFIPPTRITHMQWRIATPLRGPIPKHLDLRGRMLRKLHTKRGKELYKRRETSVEPVFGHIKWHRNLRQLLLRGQRNAKASWLFECAIHNLLKMRSAGAAWA